MKFVKLSATMYMYKGSRVDAREMHAVFVLMKRSILNSIIISISELKTVPKRTKDPCKDIISQHMERIHATMKVQKGKIKICRPSIEHPNCGYQKK
jgi:hypothetical protein